MESLLIEEADPDEPRPAGPLFVPVRLGSAGGHQMRFMRTPLGVRTAVGFTSERRLKAVLGEDQSWVRLAEPALRALSEPLGVTTVTVDPGSTNTAPPGVASHERVALAGTAPTRTVLPRLGARAVRPCPAGSRPTPRASVGDLLWRGVGS
ncbi:SAV_915 family protein [Streptomyces sp. NPDC057445]|uniref:SAV_915 family protein n=1 Tax=Streptomyces sp. NPDC057445 TaxID=3346136 RepID=UPI0036B18F55